MAEKISEVKKALESNQLIIGTERVVKNIKLGKISKVFFSSNCPEDIKEKIGDYSKISKTELIDLEYSNEDLGALCKKPFSILVLGLVKGGS